MPVSIHDRHSLRSTSPTRYIFKMNKRILELALKGLEAERDRVDEEIAAVKAQLNGGGRTTAQSSSAQAAPKATGQKGGITAAGRQKLAEAMRRRWAAKRKAGGK
jgi:hypothetical protein